MRYRHLVVLASASLTPAAAQDLIAVAWSGGVYAVDSHTGAASLVGTGQFGQNALAVDGNGTYWTTHRTGPNAGPWLYELTVLDPLLGATFTLFPGVDLRGLTGNGSSVLWGIQDGPADQLVAIDTATGAITPIGSTGRSSIQALAFHQGVLYAWDLGAGLMTIDVFTGAATDPFPLVNGPGGLQYLASHPDGRLLVGGPSLYAVDPTTGTAALIGSSGGLDLRGLEQFGGFWVSYGAACNGASGPAQQTIGGPLRVGTMFSSTSINHAPQSLGVMVLGFSDTVHGAFPLPVLLDPILGTSGCSLYASIDANLVGVAAASTPATLSYSFLLPPGAANVLVFCQHACFEPVAGSLSWSNGARVQIR